MARERTNSALALIAAVSDCSRPRVRRWGIGWLGALLFAGCAAVEPRDAPRAVDVLVLTTDRETAEAFRAGMNDVDALPAPHRARTFWSRGRVPEARGKGDYSVLLGLVEEQDVTTTNSILSDTFADWHPRYVLAIGTALAVEHDASVGDVGIVTLTCDFDLQRFEASRDMGQCYRSDGGLFAGALSIADPWEAAAKARPERPGCQPARVIKLAALSGDGDPSPGAIKAATGISEEIHRAVIMERRGINVARAVEEFRHEMREPIGFLMIRGVSEIPDRTAKRMPNQGAAPKADPAKRSQDACVVRDTADFAIELIHRGWPISPIETN